MRVVCPWTRLQPDTEAALKAQAPQTEFVDVSGSPTAYWSLLSDLWALQEDFIVVEHDVVIAPGTIAGFEACPESWCGCRSVGGSMPFLQCTRFRRELTVAYPNLLLDIPPGRRHWDGLDMCFLPQARGAPRRQRSPARGHADPAPCPPGDGPL
jgi:hypothetical protein